MNEYYGANKFGAAIPRRLEGYPIRQNTPALVENVCARIERGNFAPYSRASADGTSQMHFSLSSTRTLI
jgi:hypothetical protein